ncbi:Aminotransferase class V [Croceitalea dokdonensis DOKDO 023]|uniref:Aminotransferase class V n=1 Tax=Croceitalea dokdonensis DOKDO 023 TaxID=1300341 RepID=A0A0P7B0K7_9FLAO|nr:aminotransferase class V-fold PLP-dependent enzyme [Croceitalea dokdonensis]KPM32450.1 Aminotransferase class V [Croceitalea dokdonensis DOKDO 023]
MNTDHKEFPILHQYIYANTAATGLLGANLLEWRQEHDLDYLVGGSMMKMHANAMLADVRKTVGHFFNASSEEIILVPSFTLGLNVLLEGLSPKEKVLLLKGDYPSLNRPFESRDFKKEYINITDRLEEAIYEAVQTKKITVLALSVVQWLDGIKIDLGFLHQLKKDFPSLLILADGTQFLGTSNFDFQESAIDVIGASAYKWLLSGFGNGILLVSEAAQERFKIRSNGYGSGRNQNDTMHQRTFAKRMEPGHLDTLNFGSLGFALSRLKNIGMDSIGGKIDTLSYHAKEVFTNLGLLSSVVVKRPLHSSIFNIKGGEATFGLLTQENIVCSQRGDGIRLSFHYYNTVNEIDRIADILKK